MIGEIIITDKGNYTITEAIAIGDRPNGHIYLCTDARGNKFAAKHFYDKPASPIIGYSVYNHYGSRRDGSEHVFNEIREKNDSCGFLLKHIARTYHKGKCVIILEYIEGDTILDYINLHYKTDAHKVNDVVSKLAKMLVTWHSNGFAHGDPHTENAMIEKNSGRIVLIDYSQIHHKDFYYCQQYECFSPDPMKRIVKDIENDDNKLGKGFRTELDLLQIELKIGTMLTDVFDQNYTFNQK